MIRRPPRSTHCISSAASDVYKRQLYISPLLAWYCFCDSLLFTITVQLGEYTFVRVFRLGLGFEGGPAFMSEGLIVSQKLLQRLLDVSGLESPRLDLKVDIFLAAVEGVLLNAFERVVCSSSGC
eukprot:TRINITY_DN7761_c0_g1_i3.p3 TRINITY_DN7761_c0_g1~~TRINITY_DN7761_c0_g1_i3.p3  ORF type:complete len:131 (-),score=36.87 TRINITY_DN7761_c0_g1_i3:178-549(-)